VKRVLLFVILIISFNFNIFSEKYSHDFFLEYSDGNYHLIQNKETRYKLPNEVFRMRSWQDGVIYKDRASLNIDKFREWFGKIFKGFYCCSITNQARSCNFYKVDGSLYCRMFTNFFTVIYSDALK
jgi:hypothetical protein